MAPARLIEEEEYDYIVCGGGTSGCVVTGRLAENPNVKILVIEAGPDSANNDNVHMCGAFSQNFDSETDWNIVSEPMRGVDGRQVKLSRGRLLGGSSGVNGTACVRGPKQDYDDWGLEGWSGEEVYRYMAKAETFLPPPEFKGDPSVHGTSGPLKTGVHTLAPISELFKESLISQGIPLHDDMFATGGPPHGCGHFTRTNHQGRRSLATHYITGEYARDNITIICETTVDKVIIEKREGDFVATGAAIILKSGERRQVRARKEVIVSGGAYCSPAILMRSGIGLKDELEKHNIECLVDLPGVGKNLRDHIVVFTFYEVNKDGLTNDYRLYHTPNGLADEVALWKQSSTGVLSSFMFGILAYARIDDRLADSELWKNAPRKAGRDPMGLAPNQPQIEIWNTELYGGPKQYIDFPIDKKHAFGVCTLLFNQHSSGTVALKSKDPLDNPVVDHNYLDNELDLLMLAEGCRFANEIVLEGSGTKDVIKGAWPADLTHHKYTTREDWIPHVKQHATTCYHPSGTCKMGKSDDPLAVLNKELRVRGVQNLRVVDVSVMPNVNNGHTQMPAYAIGEKAADLIKEAARK